MKITLEDSDYCEGCQLLEYDEKASTPSPWIGEGYYVHRCRLYNKNLLHYLYHPIRLEECKKENDEG